MEKRYYKGEVFIIKIINNDEEYIDSVYTNQYAADEVAFNFNEKAKQKNIPMRMAVICRSLYE